MQNPLAHLSNLQQRIIVGLLGIALFLGLIFSGYQGAVALFGIITGLCLYEFYTLSPFQIPIWMKCIGISVGLVGYSTFVLSGEGIVFWALPSVLALIPGILILLVFSGLKRPFETASWMVMGWFYLVIPWICMLWIGTSQSHNPYLYLGLFGLLWTSDTGAYAAGRTLGKTKLLPRVSPKKTWEGLFGGLLAAFVLAWIMAKTTNIFSLDQWILLAASTTIFGTLGDLAESALKRSLDVKDSGTMLPGHGGILDRFDGLFVAAPVNALLVYYFFS